MINGRTHAVLEDIVRRTGRSLLQYVSESFPWTTPEEQAALDQMQGLVEEERKAVAALINFLIRHRLTPPALGAYPMTFTNINYVSLEHLLPMLAEAERRAVMDLKRDLEVLQDTEARAQVQNILEVKRQHLEKLRALAAAHPETASTLR